MRTIALYTTETMADWEYAYLTTQITGAEHLKPGRFRLLLVGDGLEPVRTLGNLPLAPEADLDALDALAEEGSLAALVIPGGNHYAAGHEQLIKAVDHLVDGSVPVAAICGATATRRTAAAPAITSEPEATGRRPAAARSCGSNPAACLANTVIASSRGGIGRVTFSRNRSSCASGSG